MFKDNDIAGHTYEMASKIEEEHFNKLSLF